MTRVNSGVIKSFARGVLPFCVVLLCQCAFAQVDSGTITGRVRNPAGDGAAGAKIVLRNEVTTIEKTTYTREDGIYIFAPVKVGTYSVSVELQGFDSVFQTGVMAIVQQPVIVNFNLVAAQGPGEKGAAKISTSSYSMVVPSDLISPHQVETLPVSSRNATFLAQLVPGVTPGVQTTTHLADNGSFAVNGTQPYQNNYILDGVDNNNTILDFAPGTAYGVLPSMEAVQEFRVQGVEDNAAIGGGSGAAINIVTKSGGNEFHGSAWGYVSNDKLNAADFFDNASAVLLPDNVTHAVKKARLRKSAYGANLSGPLIIPNWYDGKKRTFFFADYEGTKIRQGVPTVATVPTWNERNSGYTDFSDLTSAQANCTEGTNLIGQTIGCGTVLDPATTRMLTWGQADPVTGVQATGTGYVRTAFKNNQIPANRIDTTAVGILNLYPTPTISGIYDNFTTNEASREDYNSFDLRVDHNLGNRDQAFGRFSVYDAPHMQAGPFGGAADGGGYTQTAVATNSMFALIHAPSSTSINEIRLAGSTLRAERLNPYANDLNYIPLALGILGVPQVQGNGGLSTINIGSLSQMGSSPFLYSADYNATLQALDNFSKTTKAHTVKGGGEVMQISQGITQPNYARGMFNFGGNFTSLPNAVDPTTAIAQFVLTPTTTTVPDGEEYVGGPNQVGASNIATSYQQRLYLAGYLQDEWKYSPKLTLTVGGRWEYFQPWKEKYSAESNFLWEGATGKYFIPSGRGFDTTPCGASVTAACTTNYANALSTSFQAGLTNDGIALNYVSRGNMMTTQKTNVAPRLGFAYQLSPTTVIRGGYGIFYGGLQNLGVMGNLNGNYPWSVNYMYTSPDSGTPITYPSTSSNATLEDGLAAIPLSAPTATAEDMQLRGVQSNYKTPYSQGYNLTLQHELSRNESIEVSYVGSMGHHLLANPGSNEVSEILPTFQKLEDYVPYEDFAPGSSYIVMQGTSYSHSGRVQYTKKVGQGLDIVGNYTYSEVRTDALDMFSANPQTYRAPYIQKFGLKGDYGLADFSLRSVAHLSGGYTLPFGPGKLFFTKPDMISGKVLGGWTLNWVGTYASGPPVTIPCTVQTTTGAGCDALLVPGAKINYGKHNVDQFWNPLAFQNPYAAQTTGQSDLTPLGGAPMQAEGPNLLRLDVALRRSFRIAEAKWVEFGAEAYNVANHPWFSSPSILNFNDLTNFGKITSTRDDPNDAREIQFEVRLYF